MEIAQYLVIIRGKFPYIAWADIILTTNELNPLAETTQSLSKMLQGVYIKGPLTAFAIFDVIEIFDIAR